MASDSSTLPRSSTCPQGVVNHSDVLYEIYLGVTLAAEIFGFDVLAMALRGPGLEGSGNLGNKVGGHRGAPAEKAVQFGNWVHHLLDAN